MARLSLLFLVLARLSTALSVPLDDAAPPNNVATNSTVLTKSPALPAPLCFPSLGFVMPDVLPPDNTEWWCDPATEYAFLGFSYEITDCQSLEQLNADFRDIRQKFNSRYIRLYGFCDNEGYYNDVVSAAWDNALGVHALIWFGFNGDLVWVPRRDAILALLHANPKAKFVTRVLQFGSEPLFDNAIAHDTLAEQVVLAQANLSSLHIPVTVSELATGYQERGGGQDVLDVIDSINIHMLPFFSTEATTSDKAWPLVLQDLNWFIEHGNGKKMYFDENGWPSIIWSGVEPNSPDAVADVPNEQGYYALLEENCEFLRDVVGAGIGWFAHIYTDEMEPGYGIYDDEGNMKFPFAPRTHC
ncbi:uncharacterized protein TRAVEDRAFT_75371 [Trametes versicolor FP-101664 SS1]|uniref:uncharacterized protein n=1 Tax=Trametes versicolor (strain FP-101664) TaxID=717944 RepID=UPI0004623F61|nr:uncharacterized protein TRAVEDRAFT_75371 [Trametes versicolor FP-101664 SS1]EIW52391.1 hypothetical protein TRAVEDRAFT_75371 [Trametes versicolor FP-101664 SS1]